MNLNDRFFIIYGLVFLLGSATLRADTVFLRGGAQIYGKVIDQNRTRLRIRTRGKVRTIFKNRIRLVEYGSAARDAIFRKRYERRLAARKAARLKKERLEKQAAARREAARKAKAKALKAERAAARKRTENKKTPFDWRAGLDPAWRSAVFPGWGHFYSGNDMRGYISRGVFFASLAYAAVADASASGAQSDYDAILTRNLIIAGPLRAENAVAGTPPAFVLSLLLNTDASSDYDTKTRQANNALGLVGIVYLAQIAHAYFYGGEPAKLRASSRNREASEWRIAVIPPDGKRGAGRILFKTNF